MTVPVQESPPILARDTEFLADLNDPTAGYVANARELASAHTRMIADPAPLGLGAFALTTFLLSLVNAGILPKDTEPMVLAVALAFGGIAQLLAGMWEFRKGNVFGATVFTSYGAFWLSFWAYLTFFAEGIPTEHHGVAAGWYLIAWAIFTDPDAGRRAAHHRSPRRAVRGRRGGVRVPRLRCLRGQCHVDHHRRNSRTAGRSPGLVPVPGRRRCGDVRPADPAEPAAVPFLNQARPAGAPLRVGRPVRRVS